MSKRTAATLKILYLIVIFIGLNVIAGATFRSARLDLTSHRLYTLGSGTRAMLNKLDEPIMLRLYFSERLAANYQTISAYGLRVRDLLHELAQAAHGKLMLEVIDPEPYSPEEEFAESYGLTGAQTETGEKLFLGLVGTNLVDGLETIAFLSPDREDHLEYDVASLIHTLSTPDKPKLGIISSLPLESGPNGYMAALQGGRAEPYVVYEQLKKSFDVQMLKDDIKSVPPEIGALMIAHVPGLKPATLYAIDQFAMRGGRLVVLVDPFSEVSGALGGGMSDGGTTASDIAPLLAAWGVKYDPQVVVLDRARALAVQFGAEGRSQPVPYVAWFQLKGDDLNRSDLVTSDIDTLQIASAGHLDSIAGATTKFAPLVQTSMEASVVPAVALSMGGDPPTLLDGFKSANKRFTIAARVVGPVKSAYPAGPPSADKPDPAKADPANPDAAAETLPTLDARLPAHLAQSKSPLNLIVVADTDFLQDRFWVQTQTLLGRRIAQPTSGNGYFIINAVDNFLGSPDLISLRSRAKSDRPFTVVQDLQRKASDQYRTEEERLKSEIDQTEGRLAALQGGKKDGADALVDQGARGPVLTGAEAREVKRFQGQLAQSRRALREVQRKLRGDVIKLGDRIKAIDITLVPLLVAAVAVVLALMRRRRRYRARTSESGG
jgi:ABC-type uncharacterized transport system involved in gliding motility auxiliary subunit